MWYTRFFKKILKAFLCVIFLRTAPEEEATLLSKCHEAKLNSYSPYSNFPVGAALLTKQGKLYTGRYICLSYLYSKCIVTDLLAR